MAATLGEIEEALFQALCRINPAAASGVPGVPSGPPRTINGASVKYIGRWVGEPVRSTPVPDYFRTAIQKEVNERTPGILLGFDGESVDPRPNAVETLNGSVETVGVSTWSVLVVVRDARATRALMQGTPAGDAATLGVYDVEQLVEEALTNLGISGLYRSSNVRFSDSRALIISPGELYVLQMRYQTRRVLADVRETGTDPAYATMLGTDLLALNAEVNLYPSGLAGDFADNPFTSVVAYPGGAAPPPDHPPLRGLLARFDAAFVNGADRDGAALALPNAGEPVAQWRDRHSGRWLLAQADPALQPWMDASAIGEEPGVVFAAGDVLAGHLEWLPVDVQARSVAIVCTDLGDSGGARQVLAGWGGEPTTAALNTAFDLGLTVGATRGFVLDAGAASTVQTASVPDGLPWLLVARYTGTSVVMRAVPLTGAGSSASLVATLATPLGDFAIGRAGLLVGTVCEVLVYRTPLDEGDEAALLLYALARYGIAGT